MIEVNSGISYLGREIKEWCMSIEDTTDNACAAEIKRLYFSEDAEYKAVDNVYYFVTYCSTEDSYKSCGSLNMWGARLKRDLEKSPRKRRKQ